MVCRQTATLNEDLHKMATPGLVDEGFCLFFFNLFFY